MAHRLLLASAKAVLLGSPLSTRQAAPAGPPEGNAAPAAARAASTKTGNEAMARVLLVEDDRPLRTALLIALKRDGWEAQGTEFVEEAACVLRQGPFDLVVTDYLLAIGLDGLSLLEHIRTTAGPPAILISGSPHPELATLARQHGAFAFLRKPFEVQAFLELCRVVLRCDSGHSRTCKRPPESLCSSGTECVPTSRCCSDEAPGKCSEPYDMCHLFPE